MDRFGHYADRVQQVTGRMAGGRDMQALAIAAGLGQTGVQLYGLADLFMGDTNGINSGEIPLNFLIAHLPAITAAGGLVGALASTPGMVASVHHDALGDEVSDLAQKQAERMRSGRAYTREEKAELLKKMADATTRRDDLNAQVFQAAQELNKGAVVNDAVAAKELINRAGMRRGAYGALAGTIVGGIPAVMMMGDRPSPQQQPAT